MFVVGVAAIFVIVVVLVQCLLTLFYAHTVTLLAIGASVTRFDNAAGRICYLKMYCMCTAPTDMLLAHRSSHGAVEDRGRGTTAC